MAPLIVITGPTASGKSALALELAERYQGEIICADSRTIYRGMDIGTAKPTEEDRARVPHHVLDVVNPGERFTVHDFQVRAMEVIADIRGRGKIPFLVGGTGLYVDSVILEYGFASDDRQLRDSLEVKSVDELTSMLKEQHIPLPENSRNKRHLIYALVAKAEAPQALSAPRDGTVVVAIATEKHVLEQRIRERARQMIDEGVIDEARRLAQQFGWDSEAMTGNIYPLIHQHLEGKLTLDELIDTFVVRDRQLAKRQITWLKRHEFVQWLPVGEAHSYLSATLDNYR